MNNEEIDFTNSGMLRTKAELKLKGKQKKMDVMLTEMEVKKLMYELQVHQIELEMQNEELRQAYNTTESALKKYTMLYDFSPMGYLTLDSEATIFELNFTAAEILGDKRIIILNSNFKLFVEENSKRVFNRFLNNLYETNEKKSCHIKLGYGQNPPCRVYMEGIVTDDDRKCLISFVDTSGFEMEDNL